MDRNDIFYMLASLAALLGIVLVIVIAAIFFFSIGSPLLILGGLIGMGIGAIGILIAVLIGLITVWYVIYALVKEFMDGEEPPKKGSFTLDRIKKS